MKGMTVGSARSLLKIDRFTILCNHGDFDFHYIELIFAVQKSVFTQGL